MEIAPIYDDRYGSMGLSPPSSLEHVKKDKNIEDVRRREGNSVANPPQCPSRCATGNVRQFAASGTQDMSVGGQSGVEMGKGGQFFEQIGGPADAANECEREEADPPGRARRSRNTRGGERRRGRPRSVNQNRGGGEERRSYAPFTPMDELCLAKAWVL